MNNKKTRKRRNLVITIAMALLGTLMIILGLFVFLISIPLLFVIIGVFTLPGSFFIMAGGWVLIRDSIYKNGKKD